MSMDGAAPMPAGAPTSRPTGGTHAMHAAPAAKPANPPASAEADTSARARRRGRGAKAGAGAARGRAEAMERVLQRVVRLPPWCTRRPSDARVQAPRNRAFGAGRRPGEGCQLASRWRSRPTRFNSCMNRPMTRCMCATAHRTRPMARSPGTPGWALARPAGRAAPRDDAPAATASSRRHGCSRACRRAASSAAADRVTAPAPNAGRRDGRRRQARRPSLHASDRGRRRLLSGRIRRRTRRAGAAGISKPLDDLRPLLVVLGLGDQALLVQALQPGQALLGILLGRRRGRDGGCLLYTSPSPRD